MNSQEIVLPALLRRLLCVMVLVLLASAALFAQSTPAGKSAPTARPDTARTIDRGLIGVWGVDAQGGYDFRANGTFVMQGAITYRFDASNGVWHYWQAETPAFKVAADYKLSADGKSLSINLKKGKPFTNLKRIK